MGRTKRNHVSISYFEPEEPSFDDYIFCSSCGDYVYEYCAIHGPLLVIPDDQVPATAGFPPLPPRAALTLPREFLHLAPSTIPGAGIGVFSTLTLPRGVRFGPYRGLKTNGVTSQYCWQIFDRDRRPSHALDARDPNKSNWMRYVNCSRHYSEQNLVAFQYQGQLYYRTIKVIPRFTELLVFYGSEFANELNIDLRRYHLPAFTETLVKCEGNDANEVEARAQEIHDVPHTQTYMDNISLDSETQYNMQKPNNQTEVSEIKTSVIHLEEPKKVNVDSTLNDHYICDHCGLEFYEKSILISHIAAHTRNAANEKRKSRNTVQIQKYSCSICDAKFTFKSDLINHRIIIHNSKKVYKACNVCDYKTVENYQLLRHMTIHNMVNHTMQCNICKENFPSHYQMRKHRKLHGSIIKCRKCDLNFTDRNDYVTHCKTHELPCTVCNKKFPTPYLLKRHTQAHSEDRPYVCQIANIKCMNHNDINEYIEERNYNICGKKFKTSYWLRKHMKTHDQERS